MRAPLSGVVLARSASPGLLVERESVLFDLADLTQVWAVVDLYEKDLGQVVRDGHIVNREAYLFAAEELGIEPPGVTFPKGIAPILQGSFGDCHREGGGAPMSLMTYEEARPWAPLIKYRTAIRDRIGTMPPWYVEPGIGIQSSLSAFLKEQERTIAIMKAVGAGSRFIIKNYFGVVSVLGLAGTILGLGASFLLARFLPDLFTGFQIIFYCFLKGLF